MKGWFDLANYDDVKRHHEMIYQRVADKSMPCDCPWSQEKIDLFKSWIDQGMPRLSSNQGTKLVRQ